MITFKQIMWVGVAIVSLSVGISSGLTDGLITLGIFCLVIGGSGAFVHWVERM